MLNLLVSSNEDQAFNMTIAFADNAAIPENDMCANALAVDPQGGRYTVDISLTYPTYGIGGANRRNPDAWYQYTASATGVLVVATCDSVLDWTSMRFVLKIKA